MNSVAIGKANGGIDAGRTSTGKEHFEVLDDLRGSAAFLIVIFHLFNYSFGWDTPLSLVRHAYLAVDFFFGLSGFVVAYAYDDCWTKMSIPPILSHPAHPAPSAGACWCDFRPLGLSLRSVWKGDQPHSSADVAPCVCDLIAVVAFTSSWRMTGGNSGTQRAGLVTHAVVPRKHRLRSHSSPAACDRPGSHLCIIRTDPHLGCEFERLT
jgi:hypothetical protein